MAVKAIISRVGPEEVTFTFAQINAGTNGSATATLKGAQTTMQPLVTFLTALPAGVQPQRIYVSAQDTISVTLDNPTAGNITPGAISAIVSCV